MEFKPPADPAVPSPPGPGDASLTIDELSDATGLTRRTIRFYVISGVVAGPIGQGPSARYPRAHVPRLRLVRRWQDEGLQLAVIAQRLAALSDVEASALVGAAPPPSEEPPPESPRSEPSSFSRSPWERFELEPGVELHVRRPLTTAANRRVQRLLELAATMRQER